MNTAGTVGTVVGSLPPNNVPVSAGAFEKTNPGKADAAYLATFNFATTGPTIATAANAAKQPVRGIFSGA